VLRHGPDELDKYQPHAEMYTLGSERYELSDEHHGKAKLIVALASGGGH
jgi:hypothetical protein